MQGDKEVTDKVWEEIPWSTEGVMEKESKSSSRPITFCLDIVDSAVAGSFQVYILPQSNNAVE